MPDFTKNPFDAASLSLILFAEKNNSGAAFTVRSKATGKDFTFKIKRSEFKDRWFTHVYVETQYMEFKHLGFFADNGKIIKKRQEVVTPAAKAIGWILYMVRSQYFDSLKKNVEFMHLGSCLKCGRTLTDAESIQSGLGPVCRSK